ncbi:hypothetical protein IAQ61_001325 [Plenodomus lingam]|nr:hypothetical protein IAQ61_001325 [Plenodomus lingam]
MPETYDHNHQPVDYHMARVNGILHRITAGSGAPLLLLRGTPKNHYSWYRRILFLSSHFTLIGPDLRGLGIIDNPPLLEAIRAGQTQKTWPNSRPN